MLDPPLDPNFVLGDRREHRDHPDVGENGFQHVEDPRGERHGSECHPNKVVAHGVKGPLRVHEKAVELLFLGHTLVEVVGQSFDMPFAVTARGEAHLFFVDNSTDRRGHRVSNGCGNDPVVTVSDRNTPGVVDKPPRFFRQKKEPGGVKAGGREGTPCHADKHVVNRDSELGVFGQESPINREGDAVGASGRVIGLINDIMDVIDRRNFGHKVLGDLRGVAHVLFHILFAPKARVFGPQYFVKALDDVPHLVGGAGDWVGLPGLEVSEPGPCTREKGLEEADRVEPPAIPREVAAG